MIEYVFRIILCSALFWCIFFLILRREKMFRFNRFYLILSSTGALLIPAIRIPNSNDALIPLESAVSSGTQLINGSLESLQSQSLNTPALKEVILFLYFLLTLALLGRVLLHHHILFNKSKQNKVISFNKAKLVLTEQKLSPHSYFKYLFINSDDYLKGLIDQKIIDHEMAHIKQRHSLDILLIEILLAVCWFNPFFYFYRSSIKMNHEFLADDDVIKKHKKIQPYQHLIIGEVANANALLKNHLLTCPFNFIKTKNRLIMMSKRKSMIRNFLVQVILVPVFITIVVFFSDKSIAQEVKQVISQSENVSAQKQSNADDELQTAFDKLLKPFIKEKNGRKVYYGIDEATQKQLIPLYEKMTDAQKARQIVQYMPCLKKRMPTKEEFESWKDPEQYGVWLNQKRINNTELNNYTNEDIAHYFKSRLEKNAKNYGKHVYQLDATTNESFEAYNTRLKTDPYFVFKPIRKKN